MTGLIVFQDRKTAASEGWGLFEYGDGQIVIQADDESPIFSGHNANLDAYAFVERRAAEGSLYHQIALKVASESVP